MTHYGVRRNHMPIQKLLSIIQDIAAGKYSNDIMPLTGEDTPEPVRTIAEAMGMMMVKVEAREFRLENMLDELRALNLKIRNNAIATVSTIANSLAARRLGRIIAINSAIIAITTSSSMRVNAFLFILQ